MTNEFIEVVVDRTVSKIGLPVTPKFTRWVKRGGFAKKRYFGKDGAFFTLPLWLKNEVLEFQIAYIVHETCHFAPESDWGHDPGFYAAERAGLAVWGLTPHYRDPYRYRQYITNENGDIVWSVSTAKVMLKNERLSGGESR